MVEYDVVAFLLPCYMTFNELISLGFIFLM
jgi:hypothetical protein